MMKDEPFDASAEYRKATGEAIESTLNIDFKLFYDELVADTAGIFRRSFEYLLNNEIIIIDKNGQIRHEWTASCCGAQDEFLNEWMNNRILEDKIQEQVSKKSRDVQVSLREFGVPPRDHKYIYLATSNAVFALISEDIDFYDPTEKGRGADRVKEIKQNRKGCVCQYLRKALSIELFPLELTLQCSCL
jgi:hypothetical protein